MGVVLEKSLTNFCHQGSGRHILTTNFSQFGTPPTGKLSFLITGPPHAGASAK